MSKALSLDDPHVQLKESCKLYLHLSALLIKKGIRNLIQKGYIKTAEECLNCVVIVLEIMQEIIDDESAQVLLLNFTLGLKEVLGNETLGLRMLFDENNSTHDSMQDSLGLRGLFDDSNFTQDDSEQELDSLDQISKLLEQGMKHINEKTLYHTAMANPTEDQSSRTSGGRGTFNVPRSPRRGTFVKRKSPVGAQRRETFVKPFASTPYPKNRFVGGVDESSILSSDDSYHAFYDTKALDEMLKDIPDVSLNQTVDRTFGTPGNTHGLKFIRNSRNRDFDDLNTDDETEDENKNKRSPEWTRNKQKLQENKRAQIEINQDVLGSFFGELPEVKMSEIFPHLSPETLKRFKREQERYKAIKPFDKNDFPGLYDFPEEIDEAAGQSANT